MALLKTALSVLLLGISVAFVGCCLLFCALCVSCLASEIHRYETNNNAEDKITDESVVN